MSLREKRTLLVNPDKLISEYHKDNRGISIDLVRKIDESMYNSAIRILTWSDGVFRKAFSDFDDAPLLVYCKGDISLLERKAFAVVGSRNCNEYGERLTKGVVEKLSKMNESIISGGARGVDRIAHENALLMETPTICVLGGGFNHLYPAEHSILFNEISKKGLLLSEYNPNLSPRRYFFPERNRIIAMLSKSVIVTQASERSGSLSTATWAIEYGRDVMTFPGDIFNPEFRGNHQLIQMGATLLSSFDDILSY